MCPLISTTKLKGERQTTVSPWIIRSLRSVTSLSWARGCSGKVAMLVQGSLMKGHGSVVEHGIFMQKVDPCHVQCKDFCHQGWQRPFSDPDSVQILLVWARQTDNVRQLPVLVWWAEVSFFVYKLERVSWKGFPKTSIKRHSPPEQRRWHIQLHSPLRFLGAFVGSALDRVHLL